MANIDIDKDEILKTSKWLRFLFMALYAFAINIIIPIIIGLSFVQFLFYLFTSKPNSSIASFTSHLIELFSDTLSFILFSTDDKPFPFKKDENNDDQIIDADVEDESPNESQEETAN